MGMIQQWDASAKQWKLITDFIQPDEEVLAPLIQADAQAFAAENAIQPRCN